MRESLMFEIIPKVFVALGEMKLKPIQPMTRLPYPTFIAVIFLFVVYIGCDPNDPVDPNDPNDPATQYVFKCPQGINSACPLEGTYFEVNPLFHPNNFQSWTFDKEKIYSPYYHISVSQISPQCDKIILRGKLGQVEREIPIIHLNDSMLVIRDELIRPDNITLIRSQGGHFKDYYCDTICTKG